MCLHCLFLVSQVRYYFSATRRCNPKVSYSSFNRSEIVYADATECSQYRYVLRTVFIKIENNKIAESV